MEICTILAWPPHDNKHPLSYGVETTSIAERSVFKQELYEQLVAGALLSPDWAKRWEGQLRMWNLQEKNSVPKPTAGIERNMDLV